MTKNIRVIAFVGSVIAPLALFGAGCTNTQPASRPTPQPLPVTTPQAGGTEQSAANAPSVTSGTTNADLENDLNTFDSQMKSLNSDSANIDQGLNDQPVPQAE